MSVPVKAAKAFAESHGLKQVIIFGWDGKQTHVATYGDTVEACAQAADGANKIKKGWGWPESTLTEPPRVKALKHRINVLEMDVERLKIELELAKSKARGE